MAVDPPSQRISFFVTALFFIGDGALAYCPYLSRSRARQQHPGIGREGQTRVLYDSLSYYSEEDHTCRANNCFLNDGGNLEAHHRGDDGSTLSTFDLMSELSNDDGGADMCVFSFQELRIPNNDISEDNLLVMIYLGDNAGTRMLEFAQSNSDHVLLAACTLGRIGATAACSNAKRGVEGFDYFATGDGTDDGTDDVGTTPTYYKNRFCKAPVRKSKIDHPHAVTIFRLNSDDAENAEAVLGEWREGHATNMQWAEDTQIGAEGHLLAKIVACSKISQKFKNPSGAYPQLADNNAVCDYVGSNGKQFVAEALREWEQLCSVWPRNADGSLPTCSHKVTASLWTAAFVLGAVVALSATVLLLNGRRMKPTLAPGVDKRELIADLS